MSYSVHYTKVVVLKVYPEKEADASVMVWSRDYGVIFIKVKSYFLSISKLRNHLTVGLVSDVGLIRGRQGWKVVSASSLVNVLSTDKNREYLVWNILKLISRLVPREENNSYLFDELISRLINDFDENFEVNCVLLLLKHLGYLPNKPVISKFFNNDLINQVDRQEVVKIINQSLRNSHL